MENQVRLQRWLDDTATFLKKYLAQNHLDSTKVVEYCPPMKLRESQNISLGEAHSDEATWHQLEKIVNKSVRTSHPLFLNQLFGGIQPESMSAEFISTVLNPTMATFEVAPYLTILEKELVRKLSDLVGFKLGEGIMVTGGSNANLVGLLCARQFKVPDIKTAGYQGKCYTVYVSREAHYSYEKAIQIAGLGINHLRMVNVHENGRMVPEHLRQLILEDLQANRVPMMIGATAGTTVLGAFDPLNEIHLISREFNLWLHVDAAWGGGAVLSAKHRHLMEGIHLADSLTFDAHKTLSTGLITSLVLCKHPGMLKQTNQGGGAEYIFHDFDNSDWDTGTYSLQCGRKADALKLWLLWRVRGDEGMAKIIDHLMELAQYAQQKINNHPRLKLLSSQYLNNCFQVLPLDQHKNPNQFTLKVRTHLVQSGKALVNFVQRPDGLTFLRLVNANNQTSEKDLDHFFLELNKSITSIDKLEY